MASQIKVDQLRPNTAVTVDGADYLTFTPTGTIGSTTVQNAIVEVTTDLSASSGSSLVGFTQSGTAPTYGWATRTVQAKETDFISAKDVKNSDGTAVGSGGDDYTGLTAAAQYCGTNKKALYLPGGTTYNLSQEWLYATATYGPIKIYGDGPNTILKATGASNKALHITGTGTSSFPVVLKDLAIESGTSGTSAAGLHLDGIAHWLVESVWVDGKSKMTNGLQCSAAQQGQISGGQVQGCITGALLEAGPGGSLSNGIDWHGMTFVNTTTNFKVTGADSVFFHHNHLTSATQQIDVSGGVGTLTFTANHVEGAAVGRNGMIVRAGRVALFGNSFIGTATTNDLEFTGGAATFQGSVIGNLFNANVIIGAGVNDTMVAFNFTGGTCTDSGTRTTKFKNRAYSGTGFVDSITLTDGTSGAAPLTISGKAGGGNATLALNVGSGVNAYLQPLSATDESLQILNAGGAVTLTIDKTSGQLLTRGSTFANLGTPANGYLVYCTDCTIANPCAGGGTGAIAKRLNGVWVCN